MSKMWFRYRYSVLWLLGAVLLVIGLTVQPTTSTNAQVSPSNTPTSTPTDTPETPTNTPTSTPTDTPETPTNTPTSTPTNTPETPTNTPTSTPTNTPVTSTNTPTSTPTNTPVPSACSPTAGANELTTILGLGMGSNNGGKNVVKVVVPNAADVLRIYGQLAGKEQRNYGYARFIRSDGTFINDPSQESPAYRPYAIFWYGQQLTPPTSPHWRARLVAAPSNKPFVQRAFILYPTHQTTTPYVNVFETFDDSSRNHVFWDTAAGWTPAQQQTIALTPPLTPVSLTVSVVVVDNDRDNKPFQLTITAGGVSQMVSLNGPTHGDLLNIVQVTLNNVPAGTDEIVLDLVSPRNGESVAMVGATANYSCTN